MVKKERQQKIIDINRKRRQQQIIDILKEGPQFNKQVWEQIDKHKSMARQTYYNKRDTLLTDKVIKKEPFGNNLILYLPDDEAKLKDFKLTHFNRKDIKKIFEDEPKKQEAKKFYTEKQTDAIKNIVIEPWLEQLPTKNALIFLWSEDVFPVEKEETFQDFKNHINSDYGNPFDELDLFKQDLYKFLSIKREIMDYANNIFLEMRHEYFDERFAWLFSLKVMTDFIIDRTINRTFKTQKMDFRSIFINDFISHVEEKNRAFLYYTMNYPLEMIIVTPGRFQLSEKEFKEKMDKFVTELLTNTERLDWVQKEIVSLCELQEKLFGYIENMRKSLKKHLVFL